MLKQASIFALLAGLTPIVIGGFAYAQSADPLASNLASHKYQQCERDNAQLLKQLTEKIRLIEIERQNLAQRPKLMNNAQIGSNLNSTQGRRLRFLEDKVKEIEDENKDLKDKLKKFAGLGEFESFDDIDMDDILDKAPIAQEAAAPAPQNFEDSYDEETLSGYVASLEARVEALQSENETLKNGGAPAAPTPDSQTNNSEQDAIIKTMAAQIKTLQEQNAKLAAQAQNVNDATSMAVAQNTQAAPQSCLTPVKVESSAKLTAYINDLEARVEELQKTKSCDTAQAPAAPANNLTELAIQGFVCKKMAE